MQQVDAFLDAVRDTFSGVRQPPLTAEEIRAKKFTTTRLRPGYDEKEVDAFLEEAEARLRIRCAECGAETGQVTAVCARAAPGKPVGWARSEGLEPQAFWSVDSGRAVAEGLLSCW
jgi:DivIVA domain-containing protein